jgi:SNF2 family DNA or RNA helicase
MRVKAQVGRIVKEVDITIAGGTIYLKFPFWREMIDLVKVSFDGRKWDPDRKLWHAPVTHRNIFNLELILGKDPYARYRQPLIPVPKNRAELKSHQSDFVSHILTRKQCICAGEMGVGKTLACIEALEHIELKGEIWLVGPKSAMSSIHLEMRKWSFREDYRLFTHQGLIKYIREPRKAPQVLVVDESSKVKTPTSQRSKGVAHVANSVRDEWKDDAYVILMSGTPAPNKPIDWWQQCEIACPGYLKEGNIYLFQERLAVMRKGINPITGQEYPQIKGWKDGSEICEVCGEPADAHTYEADHPYVQVQNELEALHNRLQGLVMFKLKSECLELPEKIYVRKYLEPSKDILQTASMLKSGTALQTLILMRELSDGFQYTEDGALFIGSPKEEALLDILEDRENKLVVFAAFTASLDRILELVTGVGWGYVSAYAGKVTINGAKAELHEAADYFQTTKEKTVFVGNPGSAGMGLTLTASDMIVYYSNDFNGETRSQSEDRIHRIGTVGATIVDLINLPTDELILDAVSAKRNFQGITMGEIREKLVSKDTSNFTS